MRFEARHLLDEPCPRRLILLKAAVGQPPSRNAWTIAPISSAANPNVQILAPVLLAFRDGPFVVELPRAGPIKMLKAVYCSLSRVGIV